MNAPVRTVFVIGPDKRIKLHDCLSDDHGAQLRRGHSGARFDAAYLGKHKVATPANWNQGDDVIITAAVSNEKRTRSFPATRR